MQSSFFFSLALVLAPTVRITLSSHPTTLPKKEGEVTVSMLDLGNTTSAAAAAEEEEDSGIQFSSRVRWE